MNSHFQTQDGASSVKKSPFDLDDDFSFSQNQNEPFTKEIGEIDDGNQWNQVVSETNQNAWLVMNNDEPHQILSGSSNNFNSQKNVQNNDISIFDELNQDYAINSQDVNQTIAHNHAALDYGYNDFPQYDSNQSEIFAQPAKTTTQVPEQNRYPEPKEKQQQQQQPQPQPQPQYQIPPVLVSNPSFESAYTKQIKQWEEEVRLREELEKKKLQESRELAEQQIDEFYDKRTDRKANLQAKNREQQEQELEREEIKRKEAQNPFVYISDLIDLASIPGSEEVEKERMRSILIQLKHPEAEKMENKNSQLNKSKKMDLNVFQTIL